MTRTSEIARAGLGDEVERMAADGDSAPRIAAAISGESGKQFSKFMVQRHLQKCSVNAAVTPSGAYRALDQLAAAIAGVEGTRDQADPNTAYYGRFELNTANVYDYYYSLARDVSGQVSRAFETMAYKVTNGARIVGDENDAEQIKELTTAIDFSSLLQDVVRSTCELGTSIVGLKSDTGESMRPQLLPMSYITLLTQNETVGEVAGTLVHGDVDRVILNEDDDDTRIEYLREDVGLFRLWAGGNKFIDIKGRNTSGIYGRAMVIGIETPLKSLLNSSYYYDEFVKRYGLGRLHINLKLLADMIKEQTVNRDQAQVAQDADTAALQKLNPNEDIISAGREVSMIESKQGFDLVPYLNWRERQIDRALLQSDVGAGNVGSSWTSAGTAVSLQDYDTYKSLRETIFGTFFTEIIVPRLPDFGLDPKSVSLTATPFLRVDVPYVSLIDMHDRGIITEGELRDRAGFPEIKPDTAL